MWRTGQRESYAMQRKRRLKKKAKERGRGAIEQSKPWWTTRTPHCRRGGRWTHARVQRRTLRSGRLGWPSSDGAGGVHLTGTNAPWSCLAGSGRWCAWLPPPPQPDERRALGDDGVRRLLGRGLFGNFLIYFLTKYTTVRNFCRFRNQPPCATAVGKETAMAHGGKGAATVRCGERGPRQSITVGHSGRKGCARRGARWQPRLYKG
jgi:hypothetical protein